MNKKVISYCLVNSIVKNDRLNVNTVVHEKLH